MHAQDRVITHEGILETLKAKLKEEEKQKRNKSNPSMIMNSRKKNTGQKKKGTARNSQPTFPVTKLDAIR